MNELRDRGIEDILIAVVDGLKGFPEAIAAVFPRTQVQACIVHLMRNSLEFVSYKDRRAVAAALIGQVGHAGRASLLRGRIGWSGQSGRAGQPLAIMHPN